MDNLTFFLKVLVYSVAMTLQVFIPCYYGNQISLNSEKLSTILFHSGWIEKSSNHKRSVMIMMENARKPIRVTAMGFESINIGTFTNILNSAYSLYALFKKENLSRK